MRLPTCVTSWKSVRRTSGHTMNCVPLRVRSNTRKRARSLVSFPPSESAPEELRKIRKPWGCGPFAAWGVLKYFGLNPAPEAIIAECRYAGANGTHLTDIAAALVGFGLKVEYSSNDQPVADATERSKVA